MNKLFPIVLALLFFSCGDSASSDSSSITYSVTSLLLYESSNCNGDAIDVTQALLDTVGIFQVTINDDGTAIITTLYYCGWCENSYDNQEDCEENGCVWGGGDTEGTWTSTDNGYSMNWTNPVDDILNRPFTISGTTMTMVESLSHSCYIWTLEAE